MVKYRPFDIFPTYTFVLLANMSPDAAIERVRALCSPRNRSWFGRTDLWGTIERDRFRLWMYRPRSFGARVLGRVELNSIGSTNITVDVRPSWVALLPMLGFLVFGGWGILTTDSGPFGSFIVVIPICLWAALSVYFEGASAEGIFRDQFREGSAPN
jgi:hypothetical protein